MQPCEQSIWKQKLECTVSSLYLLQTTRLSTGQVSEKRAVATTSMLWKEYSRNRALQPWPSGKMEKCDRRHKCVPSHLDWGEEKDRGLRHACTDTRRKRVCRDTFLEGLNVNWYNYQHQVSLYGCSYLKRNKLFILGKILTEFHFGGKRAMDG